MVGFETTCKAAPKGVIASEIGNLKTQFDVFRFMNRVVETYGSNSFLIFNLAPINTYDLQSNIRITSWPPELVSAFSQEDIISKDPMLQRLRAATVPFFCDANDAGAEDEAIARILALLKRYQVERCAHFPVHNASGARGCVSITGNREKFSEQEMSDLTYITIHVFERLTEIRDMERHVSEMLTEREVDCLNLTAAGKTSAEIADIVGLSEHTVNHYLNRATKKLDTVNRTQAVAKALRIGIIE